MKYVGLYIPQMLLQRQQCPGDLKTKEEVVGCSNVGIAGAVVLAEVDVSASCSKKGFVEGVFGSTEALFTLPNCC